MTTETELAAIQAEVAQIVYDLGLEEKVPPEKDLQTTLGAISLDMVNIQVALEDAFGVEFNSGLDRSEIDEDWDRCRSVADVSNLILKWRAQ